MLLDIFFKILVLWSIYCHQQWQTMGDFRPPQKRIVVIGIIDILNDRKDQIKFPNTFQQKTTTSGSQPSSKQNTKASVLSVTLNAIWPSDMEGKAAEGRSSTRGFLTWPCSVAQPPLRGYASSDQEGPHQQHRQCQQQCQRCGWWWDTLHQCRSGWAESLFFSPPSPSQLGFLLFLAE